MQLRNVIQTSINYGVDVSVMDEVTLDIMQYFLKCMPSTWKISIKSYNGQHKKMEVRIGCIIILHTDLTYITQTSIYV